MIPDKDPQNPEEQYFYKLNKDLLEQKRKELDAKKSEMPMQTANANWMKCPKCASQMEEIELMKIKVDKCTQCSGLYFDNGELQVLLESKEPTGFLGMLKKVF